MEKYEKLEDIGTGSFGKVCKIKRLADEKILVWKEMNYGKMSEKARKQLMREIMILRELRHENIVKFMDKFKDEKTKRFYIVMEYCAGGDLA